MKTWTRRSRGLDRCARLGKAFAVVAGALTLAVQGSAQEASDVPTARLHGPASTEFPSHTFRWAARAPAKGQVGINFGLVQPVLGGFNVAGEFRYRRLWLEYSHGIGLTLNNAGGGGLTDAERRQDLHVFVPYTTGFGVGLTLLDEMWLGLEFKAHRYRISASTFAPTRYETYSIGPVLGYRYFVWRGLHANAYFRYWPNVGSSLDGDRLRVATPQGEVTHDAHDFGFFANLSLGYALDL
jgi:hypothetical protein